MKRILLSLVILASALFCRAGEPGRPTLAVTTKDGNTAVYALRERPLVTFSGDDVVLKTTSVQMQYAFADLESFSVFYDPDIEDAIDHLPADAVQFGLTAENLTAGGLQPGEDLQLFTIDGKRIASVRASQEGKASVSLEGIPAGVVIVKTQSFTYKIQKQ